MFRPSLPKKIMFGLDEFIQFTSRSKIGGSTLLIQVGVGIRNVFVELRSS